MNYQMMKDRFPDVSLEIIQRLGHDPIENKPLVCDGKLGAKTLRAIYLPVDKIQTRMGRIALSELLDGAAEEGGNNRGRYVNRYFRMPDADPLKNRGAWCAAFVTWVLDQAYGFKACWGAIRTVKNLMMKVAIQNVKEGDCIAYRSLTRPYPAGHIGLIVVVDEQGVWTIEGNSTLKPGLSGVTARYLTRELVRSDGNKPYLIGRPFKETAK